MVSPVTMISTATQTESIEKTSFLRELANIVAQLYVVFSEISREDREEGSQTINNYTIRVYASADLMKSRGNLMLYSAALSLVVFAASMGLQNRNDQKFVQLFSTKVPEIAKLFDCRKEAANKVLESLSQIDIIKIQRVGSKEQNDRSIQDQFSAALNAEIQRCRAAANSLG